MFLQLISVLGQRIWHESSIRKLELVLRRFDFAPQLSSPAASFPPLLLPPFPFELPRPSGSLLRGIEQGFDPVELVRCKGQVVRADGEEIFDWQRIDRRTLIFLVPIVRQTAPELVTRRSAVKTNWKLVILG